MIVLKGLIFLIIILVLPYGIGLVPAYFTRWAENSHIFPWVYGFTIMLAVFQVLCTPFMYAKFSLETLKTSWLLISCALFIIGTYLTLKSKKDKKVNLKVRFNFNPALCTAIILIAIQTIFVVYYQHIDDDDAFYVGTATTAVNTNTIMEYDPYTGDTYAFFPMRYALSLFPVFCAVISELVSVHPAIFMHTVLPIWLIPLSYGVCYLIGRLLFKNNKNYTGLFLIFISILNIFGNTSVYTSSSFLLFRIWQGKAVLASIIIPIIILTFLYIEYYSNREVLKSNNNNSVTPIMLKQNVHIYWILLFVAVISATASSSMGIGLAPICVGMLGIVDLILNKKIKRFLYFLVCCIPALIYGILYIAVMKF